MGKILRTTKLTTFSELLIVLGSVGAILTAVYFISPGLKTAVSKQLNGSAARGGQLDIFRCLL